MNVAQPARRQAVDRRGADFRAEAAEVRIADIVEYNGDDIGPRLRASGRPSRRHAAQRRRGEQGADETATGKLHARALPVRRLRSEPPLDRKSTRLNSSQ